MHYEQTVAKSLFDGGHLKNYCSAFYHLYFREARKGLGIERAILIGTEAIKLAEDAGCRDVTEAISEAVLQMREIAEDSRRQRQAA
ncbi:hypothetical protein ACK6D9_11695 [Hoeflea sp. Naph1]|uniref:hypothetical protein n=1 Tax=Hoeflea sp. Naph1 TaxID=3388653 RepID=UPI00398FBE12